MRAMRFILDRWRGIGTRLYLALGFAVALTLISSGVAVYYFEQSGDHNYDLQSEAVPALESSWNAAREAERLRVLGFEVVADAESGFLRQRTDAVTDSLEQLGTALDRVSSVPALEEDAQAVNDAALDLAGVIDNLVVTRDALLSTNGVAADFRSQLATTLSEIGESEAALSVLRQALQAQDEDTLQGMWDEFSSIHATGIDPAVSSLAEGEGVFYIRGQQLVLEANIRDLAVSFDAASAALESSVNSLLTASGTESSEALGLAVSSFDEGRVLLAAISVISVIAATLAAWLWVGNGMVRRLSRMSERMRSMADGDLETPVPEVGRDEIGELASALEVFRQQALEVQRLNLVEKLYEELRVTNEELKRVQARLVAQEKLAALGELVSGVAHEISNPLNFVNNFSEGSLELYNELKEMLDNYRDRMSADDSALLDDITQEITTSLSRVLSNGGRALAIVERMRGLGVSGGDPIVVDVNEVLREAVHTGCRTFGAQWEDFSVEAVYDLDASVEETTLVEKDFNEAVLNLVSNAFYAMHEKRNTSVDYEAVLTASTRRVNDTVEIRIRDNGTGISDEVVGRIFNPFFSSRDGAEGAGLGLSIAADVARRFGGDLSVDTVYGEYAEFVMTLPIVVDSSTERLNPRSPPLRKGEGTTGLQQPQKVTPS